MMSLQEEEQNPQKMIQNHHLQRHKMNWLKLNISSIGIWLVTISFAVYYFNAKPLDLKGLSHPSWVNNIELYGELIGMMFISLGYALNCKKTFERVIIAWELVVFWGVLTLTYFLNEFLDSIIISHKIITTLIICLAISPFSYFYYRKRL